MEGISHEAASLAGTWQLGKLVAIYDDNGISIDGEVEHWFTDDTAQRFRAYGWNVMVRSTATTSTRIDHAIGAARDSDKPTLIIARTIIGKGSPNRAGTEKAHGEALGESEIVATRDAMGWPHEPFVVPKDVYASWDARRAAPSGKPHGRSCSTPTRNAYPQDAGEFERRMGTATCPATIERRWTRQSRRPLDKARNGRDPQGIPAGARGAGSRRCPRCSAARPISPAAT